MFYGGLGGFGEGVNYPGGGSGDLFASDLAEC